MADFFDILKNTASVVAPVLANAIIPGSGGLAASLLAKALGTSNDPQEINTALINATPAQLIEIKRLELENATELVRISADIDKSYLADRQNARNREVELMKATGKRDFNLYVLSWVVISGFFGLIGMMMYITVPPANVGAINILFGALVAGFMAVIGYHYGSSQSSNFKTKLLAEKDK